MRSRITCWVWAGGLFALLALGAAPAARAQGPQDKPSLNVLAITGRLVIELDGKKKVIPLGATPPPIPAGARISVVSGSVVMANERVAIKCGTGAKFRYYASRKGGQYKVRILTERDSTNIAAEIGGRLVTLGAWSAAQFILPPSGTAVVRAQRGQVTIQSPGGMLRVVRRGGTVMVPLGEETGQVLAQVAEPEPERESPPVLAPAPPQTSDQDVRVIISPSSP